MKRFLALLLTVMMIASAALLCACGGDTTTAKQEPTKTPETESKPVTPTEPASETETVETKTPVDTDDDGDTPNDIFTPLKRVVTETTHKKADEIPASYTLVGSDYLPEVLTRKDITCEAADAITYMQFTNAVARYVASKDPTSTWKPAKDRNSCFSPKYTAQYANYLNGSYDILRDNGCLTIAEDDFARDAVGNAIIKKNGKYQTQTTAWKISEGLAEQTMKYRINGYSVISTSNTSASVIGDGYYNSATKGVEITTSTNGQKFLETVKDAIVTGNVVVAQGYLDRLKLETLAANSGDLGKSGDTVIPYAVNTKETLYQFCIVGYDDNLTYSCCGGEMKGAFLICNAGDSKWGKGGYAWLMYDALNTFSEDPNFTVPETETKEWAFDYFAFIFWDTNIVDTLPTLYAEIELETANRNAFYFKMSKTDAFGRSSSIEAYQTYQVRLKNYEDYGLLDEDEKGYFNPAGEVNGGAVNGFYTVNFDRLFTALPENTTYEDFYIGLQIFSTDDTSPVVLKSIKFKNNKGEVIKTISFGEGQTITKSNNNFVFDFGKPIAKDLIVGSVYKFKNVKTDAYIVKGKTIVTMKTDNPKKAEDIYRFKIEYNTAADGYLLWLKEKTDYRKVIDVANGAITTGLLAQFNAENVGTKEKPGTRYATQFWHFSYNPDNTLTMYITTAKGTNYALGVGEDGQICLIKATELTDAIKWIVEPEFEASYESVVLTKAEFVEGGLHVTSNVGKATNASVKVYDFTGKEVAGVDDVEITKKNIDVTVPGLTKGQYIVEVLTSTTTGDVTVINPASSSYVFFN